jgi:hypothetical protein
MEPRQRVLAAASVVGLGNDMTLAIVGLIALEVIERLRSALGPWPVVSVPRVIAIVHVSMEVARSVKPGSGSDEDAPAVEPVRPVIAVRAQSYGG